MANHPTVDEGTPQPAASLDTLTKTAGPSSIQEASDAEGSRTGSEPSRFPGSEMTSSAVDVANDEDADMREEDEDDEDNANPSGSDLPQSSSATPAGIGRALQTRHYNPAGPESSGDLPEFGELERRGEEKLLDERIRERYVNQIGDIFDERQTQ